MFFQFYLLYWRFRIFFYKLLPFERKLKIGDRVKIRKDLIEDKKYGNIFCRSHHLKFSGNYCHISEIEISEYGRFYILRESNNQHRWSRSMFESKIKYYPEIF